MARSLVSELSVIHQYVIEGMNKIEEVLRSPYQQVRPSIRKIQDVLFMYFGKQDDKFFKALTQHYHSDRESIKMIEFLIHDLKEVKIKFLIFFDKYTGEMADRGSHSFPREFMQFSNEVMARIRREEDYLFPLLTKLPSEAYH